MRNDVWWRDKIATLYDGPDRSRPRKLQIDLVKGAHDDTHKSLFQGPSLHHTRLNDVRLEAHNMQRLSTSSKRSLEIDPVQNSGCQTGCFGNEMQDKDKITGKLVTATSCSPFQIRFFSLSQCEYTTVKHFFEEKMEYNRDKFGLCSH